jgi:hypothetical protein
MLRRLLGHTTPMMTNRYYQAVGCYDAIESHKRYSPMDRLGKQAIQLFLRIIISGGLERSCDKTVLGAFIINHESGHYYH